MPRRLADLWWSWAPAVGVAICLWPRLPIFEIHEDEGVATDWALQLAAGKLPYRDFVVFAGPLTSVLYGAAFKLFGTALLVPRTLDAIAILGSTVLLAVIARRLLPAAWAAAVALLWGIWLPVFLGYAPYHFWAPLLLLAMTLALLPPNPRPLLAGLAGGAALLFSQAFLFAVLAGVIVAYLVRRRPRDAALMAAGPVGIGVVLVLYLALTGSLPHFYDQTIGYTLGSYQSLNRVPFPSNPLLLIDSLNWRDGYSRYWAFLGFWLVGVVGPFLVAGYAVLAAFREPPITVAGMLALISTGMFGAALIAKTGGPVCWMSAPFVLVLLAARVRHLNAGHSPRGRLARLSPLLVAGVLGLSPAPAGLQMSCVSNPHSELPAVQTAMGTICLRASEPGKVAIVQRVAAARGSVAIAFEPDSPGLYELTGVPAEVPSTWTLKSVTPPWELAWQEEVLLQRRPIVVYIYDPDLEKNGHPWAFDTFLELNYRVVEESEGVTVYRLR
ncbi:MAG: hypothetical protein M3Z98_02805 [Candidatus Dormibacteraeota bacterium]|nr:hypothetical protein [Candidatus Dormibacteraeota bacterium]